MDAKVLFSATPGTSAATLTSGPSSGKVWTVSRIYINKSTTTTGTLSLSHYLSTATTIALMTGFSVPSSWPRELGPLVMEYGHSLTGSQSSAGIALIAYGLEESV